MNRQIALDMISEGHNVYSQAGANQVCDELGVPRIRGRVMHSDPPNTVKGPTLAPEAEGKVLVTALNLGAHVCKMLGLAPRECLGRGSQGRAYAEAIRAHLNTETEDTDNG